MNSGMTEKSRRRETDWPYLQQIGILDCTWLSPLSQPEIGFISEPRAGLLGARHEQTMRAWQVLIPPHRGASASPDHVWLPPRSSWTVPGRSVLRLWLQGLCSWAPSLCLCAAANLVIALQILPPPSPLPAPLYVPPPHPPPPRQGQTGFPSPA